MAERQPTRVLRARPPPFEGSLDHMKPPKRNDVKNSLPTSKGTKRKGGQVDLPVTKREKRKGSKRQFDDGQFDSPNLGTTHAHEIATTSGEADEPKADSERSQDRNYWLMKAEQEDREVQVKNGATINTKFTIEDLKAKGTSEPWDGVRNFVARNNMRSMKVGDLAFFYASGGSGKNKPGITGVMTVVKEHEEDWTMYDEGAYGYVEPGQRGSGKEPKWSLVHVDFKERLATPVTLAELRSHSQPGHPLAEMQLLRNGRISVSKVSAAEWQFITENLIQPTNS